MTLVILNDKMKVHSNKSKIHIPFKHTQNFLQNSLCARPEIKVQKFKVEIISRYLSDCNGMKQEINYRKKTGKNINF